MNPLERKLDAGKPHVQFDERDLETCDGGGRMRHRDRKERQQMGQNLPVARQISTLRNPLAGLNRCLAKWSENRVLGEEEIRAT